MEFDVVNSGGSYAWFRNEEWVFIHLPDYEINFKLNVCGIEVNGKTEYENFPLVDDASRGDLAAALLLCPDLLEKGTWQGGIDFSFHINERWGGNYQLEVEVTYHSLLVGNYTTHYTTNGYITETWYPHAGGKNLLKLKLSTMS